MILQVPTLYRTLLQGILMFTSNCLVYAPRSVTSKKTYDRLYTMHI